MNSSRMMAPLICVALCMMAVGCAQQPTSLDYTAFRAHPPRSILVLPPMNQSTAVEATYSYLSTVTKPLAERGYYVFPVAVVDQFLKEQGIPDAAEMHRIPPAKMREIIGADAVLYITIDEYGSTYVVINSAARVSARATLIDTASGEIIWQGVGIAQSNSGNSGGGIVGALVTAAIVQAINASTDPAHGLSATANFSLFNMQNRELPFGPYHPHYDPSNTAKTRQP
jgi:hypothetical protein